MVQLLIECRYYALFWSSFMSFASLSFIFVFLPAALILYYLAPRGNWRNLVLVLLSLAFFAWADLAHLPFLVLFVLFNYGFGLLIGRFLNSERVAFRKAILWAGVGGNLLFLVVFKYLGFLGEILDSLSGGRLAIESQALLLGVSYLTFSSLSYLIDLHKKVRPVEKNFLNVAAYLVMFPKLIQGPIALYKEMEPQLGQTRFDSEDLAWGIRRFIIGLGKKVLLADTLAVAANKVFSVNFAKIGADAAWVGLIAYSLVILFDFSGYTDMALGVGRMFGFRLPENFNYPYISRSITDFWRRWHMSLTNWFRTYVFIPLEFKRRRAKFLRQQSNILLVFLLTGLWHGASWNFVIWGAYFGLILAIEASGLSRALKKLPVILQHVYTLIIVVFGWVFFRISNPNQLPRFLGALFGANGLTGTQTLRSLNILFYIPVLLIGAVLTTPLLARFETLNFINSKVWRVVLDILLLALLVLSLAFILSNGFKAFMYARF